MSDAVAAAAAVLGDRARRDHPLGPLTTYRVGGPAALHVEARHEDDLAAVARAVRTSGLPVLVVGRGSNLLVADDGFPGIALTLGEGFATIEVDGATARAGAAVTLPVPGCATELIRSNRQVRVSPPSSPATWCNPSARCAPSARSHSEARHRPECDSAPTSRNALRS